MRELSSATYGIYAHIPFCARRCDYCDFFIVAGRRGQEGDGGIDFIDWLRRDLAQVAALMPEPRPAVDTIYLGGGTPSYIAPEEIARFLQECSRLFQVQGGAETTLEANPESVAPGVAALWRAAGVNRLSLGVQSFSDEVLAPRGRLYTAAQAESTVRTARQARFDNVGIDLIAGLPGESLESFMQGIDRLIDLAPDHVSIYLLETQDAAKRTPLTRAVLEGREALPAEDDVVEMYLGAMERLEAEGFHHYEISNLARPGRESRHNLKYWTSQPYLGVGPSAHSYLAGRRFGRTADMARWVESVRSRQIPMPEEDYTLPEPDARAREALVQGLRLLGGVDLTKFAAAWGFDPERSLAAEIDQLVGDGLIHRENGRMALTRQGVLLSNEVFARLT